MQPAIVKDRNIVVKIFFIIISIGLITFVSIYSELIDTVILSNL